MFHPFSNAKSDKFFRRNIAYNFTSLASIKAKVQQTTQSTDYRD